MAINVEYRIDVETIILEILKAEIEKTTKEEKDFLMMMEYDLL